MTTWLVGCEEAAAYAAKEASEALDESNSALSCLVYSFSCCKRLFKRRESAARCTIAQQEDKRCANYYVSSVTFTLSLTILQDKNEGICGSQLCGKPTEVSVCLHSTLKYWFLWQSRVSCSMLNIWAPL